MKINLLLGLYVTLVCVLSIAGCNDSDKGQDGPDPVYPLSFLTDSIEVRQGIATPLRPLSSNGINTLDLMPGDTSLLVAHAVIIENGTSHASGWISLTGKQKGHTSLTVCDRIAKDTVVLDVKITDFYMGMLLMGSNHPLFTESKASYLFLVDNDRKDFYLFDQKDDQPYGIIQQGVYAFSVEDNTPYLTLTVGNDAPYRFNLSQNTQKVYLYLSHFFHLGWEPAAVAGTKDIDRTMHLYMKDDATGNEASFAITDLAMPRNV